MIALTVAYCITNACKYVQYCVVCVSLNTIQYWNPCLPTVCSRQNMPACLTTPHLKAKYEGPLSWRWTEAPLSSL